MKDFTHYWNALTYAFTNYGSLKRKSSDIPYVVHPIRITSILRAVGYNEFENEDLMIAALFHDLVEDTDTSLEEIKNLFGLKVASIVNELTIPNKAEKEKHLRALKRASYEAKVIKLADRIDNLMDNAMALWSKKKLKSYVEQSRIIVNACGKANLELATKLKELIEKF